MSTYGLPVLYVLLLLLLLLLRWWFSTGVVLYLDGLAHWTHRWSLLGATAVALVALYGLMLSSREVSVIGAFVAFTGALLVWGWLELTFLTGIVTGPRKHPCAESCAGWRYFLHAVEAILYHELALIGGAALMGLAVLEHWFLVLPVPANELWRWGLRSRTMDKRFEARRATN